MSDVEKKNVHRSRYMQIRHDIKPARLEIC